MSFQKKVQSHTMFCIKQTWEMFSDLNQFVETADGIIKTSDTVLFVKLYNISYYIKKTSKKSYFLKLALCK